MSPENQETNDGEHVMNDESDFGKELVAEAVGSGRTVALCN